MNVTVAIHNKNGKGLLLKGYDLEESQSEVAIHNKNGKGLLPQIHTAAVVGTYGRNPQ